MSKLHIGTIVVVVGLASGLAHAVRAQCGGWMPAGSIPRYSATVNSLGVWDPDGSGIQIPKLIIGSSLPNGSGPDQYVTSWDGMTETQMGLSTNNAVNAILSFNGDLIVGGTFSSPAKRIMKWNPSTAAWQQMGAGLEGPGSSNSYSVYAAVNFGGDLIVGGSFVSSGGNSVKRIARWDSSTFTWVQMGSGFNEEAVNAMCVHGGVLYVGGGFQHLGDGVTPVSGVAKWDPSVSDWVQVGNLTSRVATLTSYDGSLIAGGSFTQDASGNSLSRVAVWNGANWLNMGGGMNNNVLALLTVNSTLVAGGDFSTASSTTVQNIARWMSPTATTWSAMDGGLTLGTAYVRCLAYYQNEIWAGGNFERANSSIDVDNLANWSDTGYPWFTTQPSPQTVSRGSTITLTVVAAQNGYSTTPTYQWKRDGVNLTTGTGVVSPSGWGSMSGAGTATLTITGSNLCDSGTYQCVLTNSCGAVSSANAAVTVNGCTGDYNGDGFLDFFDYDDFTTDFEITPAKADVNCDGFTDFFDYDYFVAAFQTGC